MTLDQDVALLRTLPVFANFPDDHLRLIAFSAEPLRLPAGTVLFRQGAAADGGYVVVSGSVELFTENSEDAETPRGVAGPGALIGELAVLCPTRRPASARTVEPCELMAISRRLLRRVLEEYPDIAEEMRQVMSERLRVMNADLARTREELLTRDG